MSLTIDIHVIPASGKTAFLMDKSGKFKCYLKSAPENGKANKELIKFIAKSLNIPQDNVRITQGLISKKKRITIDIELTFAQFLQTIGIDWPLNMFG